MKYLYPLAVLFFSSTSLAGLDFDSLSCAFDFAGGPRHEVSVINGYPGNMVFNEIDGFQVGVSFTPGSMFESQQLLAMSMNGITTTVYGPEDSLYVMTDESGLARLQCWVKKE